MVIQIIQGGIPRLQTKFTVLTRCTKILLMMTFILTCSGGFGSLANVAHANESVIHFPDPNLKKALIANGVDTNGDGEITIAEMESRKPNSHSLELGTLHLNRYDIQDLSGLEHAVNVRSIVLSSNPVQDLSPLSHLKNLENLSLAYTNVSDLSPLSGLPIRTLDLFNTKVRDIGPVASMSGLSALIISRTDVEDIRPLEHLRSLILLHASSTKVRDISALSTIPYLVEVNLENNEIQDIGALAHIGPSMDRLYLSSNRIQDIRPLSGMTQLKELYIEDNLASDLTPLANMNMLYTLFVDGNQIQDISPLAGLKGLKHLGLAQNPIDRIDPLSALSNLESLYLYQNSQIRDLSPISQLTKLKSLMLAEMGVSDISMLENLTQLEFLNLSNNQVRDIRPLQNMTRLNELYLQNNQISDISVLSNKNELYVLHLYGNPQFDPSPIKSLPKLTDLRIDQETKDTMRSHISDILDGDHFNTDVTITFGDGIQVWLNGQPITSGHVVSKEGHYQMELSEVVGIVKTVYFVIDKTPPIIKGVVNGETYEEEVVIIFDEGEATLNGVPVTIDTYWVDQFDGSSNHQFRVKEDGEYTLIVTDYSGNQTSLRFTIKTPDVVVRGVSNHGLYTTERTIQFSDGSATLNGKPIKTREKVSKPGEYELIVTGENGGKKTIHFTIIEPGEADPENTDPPAPQVETPSENVPLIGVSDWAKQEIEYAQGLSLTDPLADLTFTAQITREQFSEVAVKLYERLSGSDTKSLDVSDNPFQDTQNPEIVKAYVLGIVNGTAADRFSPDALITREQLATMLHRVLDKASVDIPYGQAKTFDDRNQFSDYAVAAIDYMSSIEVIKGKSERTFGAKDNASIEQAVVMAKRMYEIAEKTDAIPREAVQETKNGGVPPEVTYFRDGRMFKMYISDVQHYIGKDEPTNIYALTNDGSFILPAYSAIYYTAPINQTPAPHMTSGILVVANTTGSEKTISANHIDMSLFQLFGDNWGTMTSPDGTTQVMRSTGPYLRLIVFDGPFDSDKPYSDYIQHNQILDFGDWFAVRHDDTMPSK